MPPAPSRAGASASGRRMRKLFKAGRLNISPSQIDTYLDCPRKWWMSYILGLPEPDRDATTLGDVGHSVVARYLEGFEGENLYPKGWEQARNRWTNEPQGKPLSIGEQSLVKALVHNAIHSGMLTREPDGQVEQEIVIDLPEVPVRIKMFLDYRTQHSVVDHKFCKNTRYYGTEKLSKATAMNLYGLAGMRQGLFAGDDVWLRYNLFIKDPAKLAMKPVEVEKSRDQLEDYYQKTVLPACKGMLHMWERAQAGQVTETGWAQVQGPDTPSTCDNYGGCQFQQICSGAKSIQQYRESFEKRDVSTGGKVADLFGRKEDKQEDKQEEDKMPGFRDKLKMMKEQQAGGAPAVVETKAVPTETKAVPQDNDLGVASPGRVSAPAPKKAPTDSSNYVEKVRGLGLVAPWYLDGCKQCTNNALPGFNSDLTKPCAICAVLQKKRGGPKPDDYTIDIGEAGAILVVDESGEVLLDTGEVPVEAKAEAVRSIQPELTGTETVPEEEEIVVQETPNAPVPEPEPEPVEQTVPVTDPVVEEKPKRQRKSRAKQQPVADEPTALANSGPKERAEGAEDDDEDSANDPYPFTLSYAVVRDREGQDPDAQIGDEGVVVHISQLLEYIQGAILKAANSSGAKAETYHDVNAFTRRDLIAKNAHVIAQSLGHSTLEATCVQSATDQAHICSAIEHLACRVYGSL